MTSLSSFLGDTRDFVLRAIGKVARVGIVSHVGMNRLEVQSLIVVDLCMNMDLILMRNLMDGDGYL